MDLHLAGRSYLVTGASSGLGFASAAALNADGANVLMSSRDLARIEAASAQLTHPEHSRAVAADNGNEKSAQALVTETVENFGAINGAILSVGGPPAGTMDAVSEDQWRDAFESVFLGGLRLARAVLDAALSAPEPGDVAVTFVLSSSVKSPIPGLAISNGLRPGLAMAAKTLADEYGPRGARVNALLPGRIDTDRVKHLDGLAKNPEEARASAAASIPLRRYGTAEEFGRVAAFVTSPAASYISGVALAVDGGALRTL